MSESELLYSGFIESATKFGEHPALFVDGQNYTYTDFSKSCFSLAATLQKTRQSPESNLTGIFAQRSYTAYCGVLASLLSGNAYLPINPTFPIERCRNIILETKCQELVVDKNSLPLLADLLEGVNFSLRILTPDCSNIEDIQLQHPQHTYLSKDSLNRPEEWSEPEVDPQSMAYLLFTSGSTGKPKGVMVSHDNATHFVNEMVKRFAINERDRLSQLFEMTFDVSVFDMFVAWKSGACVCCASPSEKILPTTYADDADLTVWFSVPSTGLMLKKLGLLESGAFPNLRISIFAGEALPVELVETWATAAPNSRIDNLYGPTELTVGCTLYTWDPSSPTAHCENGTVPIGYPVPGLQYFVADENLNEVEKGKTGELLMTGPQLSMGYWQDEERTQEVFVQPPGKSDVYYRTGDRVRRPNADEPLKYLGRLDNQIKIRGNRVELGEIEAALRKTAKVGNAIALGWPETKGGADGIVAYIDHSETSNQEVLNQLKDLLPTYMIPQKIITIGEFPLNSNGKIDRKNLKAKLATL